MQIDLDDLGFSVEEDGTTLLWGPARGLFDAWHGYLSTLLRPLAAETYVAPPFIGRRTLEDAHYLAHFPQHVFCCRSHTDPDGPERYLTPAACLHVYPRLRGGSVPERGVGALILGPCARHEGGVFEPPFRLPHFHMLELVAVGEPTYVAALRAEATDRIERAFGELGLEGRFETATDAFFLDGGRGARLLQQLKELKREYRTDICGEAVALASVNDHEDFFGRCFDLRTEVGEAASSCCAAFGLERLTALGLLRWGADPETWPSALRQQQTPGMIR